MFCSYHHSLMVAAFLFAASVNSQPSPELLIENNPRDAYCSDNPCVQVYCKSPTQRWSCQTSRYYAVELENVCDYFLKTEEEIFSGIVSNDDVRSVVLPWCGSNSPPSGYEYVELLTDELCPSSYPVYNGEDYRYWTECK
ncbi:hypothetical protein M9435_005137 [Picochlorum sp. BPE23]|nr:hypothetical protein M9435_005137 [Picochlorum sp. BPE23]